MVVCEKVSSRGLSTCMLRGQVFASYRRTPIHKIYINHSRPRGATPPHPPSRGAGLPGSSSRLAVTPPKKKKKSLGRTKSTTMDFVTDKEATRSVAKGKGDVAARARAAREERKQAQAQQTRIQQTAVHAAAAARIQACVRRRLDYRRASTVQRADWDQVVARCGQAASAGQQLALANWMFRFYAPDVDDERLRTLCKLVHDGLERDQPHQTIASLALRRELALNWVSLMRRLMVAVARLLAPSEPSAAAVLATALGGTAGAATAAARAADAATATSRKQLSAHFGPLLRVLLMLLEPPKWKLVGQLAAAPNGQPAADALILVAQSAIHAAADVVITAVGSLALRVHAAADGSLLGAAVAVASLPLQGASAPSFEAARAFSLGGLLRVPALTTRVTTAASRLGKGRLIWDRVTEQCAALAPHAASALGDDPDGALCIAGNLLTLLPAQPPPSAAQLMGLAYVVEALLRLQPTAAGWGAAGKSASTTSFHLIRGWSPKAPAPAVAPHLEAVAAQLHTLWSKRMLSLLYTDALAVPLGTRPVERSLVALAPSALHELAARAQIGAALHTTALRAMPPLRATGLARLAYSTHLVAALWALLRALDEVCRAPIALLRAPSSPPSSAPSSAPISAPISPPNQPQISSAST